MTKFDIGKVAAWAGGAWTARPEAEMTGVCFDSRIIRPGDLFVALRGEAADGHRFVGKAFEGGAAAAMVTREFAETAPAELRGRPLLAVDDTLAALQRVARGRRDEIGPFIVGVTGSVGKSTVKEWTAAILWDWRRTSSTRANFNNDIGLPVSLLEMDPDTEFGVFEAGMSHPGDMKPLVAAMRPDAAVVTSIAPVHIEFFDSLAGIAREKAEMLRALPESGFAVLDARGEFFEYLAGQAKCRVVGVCAIKDGETPPQGAKYIARISDEATCRFTIEAPGAPAPVEIVLGRPGAHNVLNATLAAAAAHECGAPWDVVAARLAALPGVALRWEKFQRGGQNWICDAYNANPVAMAASIRAFAMSVPAGSGARAFVLGDMFELGADEVSYHRGIAGVLGEVGTSAGDILVCVGRLAANYASPAFKGRVFFADDALGAALLLRRELPDGATVLLKASHGKRLDRVPALFERPLPELEAARPAPVAILGAGRSGKAAQALLAGAGAETVLLDGDEPFPDAPVSLAVVSPGIPQGHPWLAACRARKIRAIGELELGSLFWRGRILAVTGSKGKSSVVKFCADALSANGRPAVPCGNYGTPLSEVAAGDGRGRWAVAEASSFQLETIDRLRPDIAVLLNLQPDHLDRHGTMAEYARAKMRIFANFGGGCVAIAEGGALRLCAGLGVGIAPFTATDGGEIQIAAASSRTPRISDLRPLLPQKGYFANDVLRPAALSAAAALASAGLPPAAIAAAFADFKPLPHRMQTVAEIDGVEFIDNSKATSLAALAASLEMAGKPVRLIAGGRMKGDDPSAQKKVLELFAKKVYLIGEASKRLFEAWNGTVPCEECGTLGEAVAKAAAEARAGEAVLLAPGCASFDQFGGYAERGKAFSDFAARLRR